MSTISVIEVQKQLTEELNFLDSIDTKYEYVIEHGGRLEAYPESQRKECNIAVSVEGTCTSKRNSCHSSQEDGICCL